MHYKVCSYNYDYVDIQSMLKCIAQQSTLHLNLCLGNHVPRSVVVPDARLKGLINEEDLELTGKMESAQDTSDVERYC